MRLILTNPATSPNNRLILAYADYMLHACCVGCLSTFKYEIQTSSSRHQSNEKISAERRLSRYLQTFVHCAALGTSGSDLPFSARCTNDRSAGQRVISLRLHAIQLSHALRTFVLGYSHRVRSAHALHIPHKRSQPIEPMCELRIRKRQEQCQYRGKVERQQGGNKARI